MSRPLKIWPGDKTSFLPETVIMTSQCEPNLLMITARTTRMMIIRMIHSLMFCHQSLRFSRVAVRWNMSAFWFRYSVGLREKEMR